MPSDSIGSLQVSQKAVHMMIWSRNNIGQIIKIGVIPVTLPTLFFGTPKMPNNVLLAKIQKSQY
jgi:hypothetical protein